MDDTNLIQKLDLSKVDWKSSREFFQSLSDELRKLDDKDEKYDFSWVGKRKSIIEAGTPINKTLRPEVKSSKNWDTTQNLFIEGDNLDALKLLQEAYLGKVKMIYIDPPYNTGKDFVYHDNFKADVEQYDESTEYKDEEGNIQFKKNEKSNGRYHSDWLSMMYPRLKLARNLLSEDGVIFISIDDNEQANLKKLCDEIFGEENFVVQFIWNTKKASKGVPPIAMVTDIHEYILVYGKQDNFKFRGITRSTSDFGNPDNDPRGLWRKEAVVSTISKKSFEIVDPKTGNKFNRAWAFSPASIEKMIGEGRIIFPKTESGTPLQKKFFSDYTNEGVPLMSQLGTFQSRKATSDLLRMFDTVKIFDFSKPTELIKFLIEQSTQTNSVIVDFFSGSGTTAHAVMKLNAEDGSNRKWIMVQLPEATPEDSEALKAGYATIPEIARERIRRAGDKIAKEYPNARVDYGFRSLVITDTNFKDVFKPVNEITQKTLLETMDNIKEDRTELDLLFGVLVQLAMELNRPIETRQIDDSTVYLYDYIGDMSGLVACFSQSVSEQVIKQIAQLKPLKAVFRDSSFPDSQAKVNLSEHFRVLSPDTKVHVI